ncbi:hypothetical protein J5N97_012615 [Dioscorea zingiberensis]|uniref:Cytochrome b561 and DOMON domain-containing protein n=1 Tax=Dioscorea zingiberensis TaxID=325984 RepID=A0A9D5CPM1_9LILI|nr:hypothetical protein J5N97_012615 [Dioscorea zingiberensis]
MVGSSALVGWINGGGMGIVKQYYLGGTRSSQCLPDQGNIPVMKDKSLIISHSSHLYLAFQLNSTQPLSRHLIFAVGPKNTWPESNNFLPPHRNKISISLNYDTGVSLENGNGFGVVRRHGMMGLIGWGVLMPMGVMVARYLKGWEPNWFYTHTCMQGIGFGLGVGAVIAGFGLSKAGDHSVSSHKSLGISILVFGSLQVMAFLVRPEKTSKVRRYWNWYHWYVGRAAIVCAMVNIFHGLSLAHEANSFTIGYGIFLGFLALVSFVMEIRMWINNNNN